MQPDEMRAALDGGARAVDAAWAKVARAKGAVLAAKAAHGYDSGPYAAAWQAWQLASNAYEGAERRQLDLLLALIPAVVWPTPTEPAHAD